MIGSAVYYLLTDYLHSCSRQAAQCGLVTEGSMHGFNALWEPGKVYAVTVCMWMSVIGSKDNGLAGSISRVRDAQEQQGFVCPLLGVSLTSNNSMSQIQPAQNPQAFCDRLFCVFLTHTSHQVCHTCSLASLCCLWSGCSMDTSFTRSSTLVGTPGSGFRALPGPCWPEPV